MRGIIYKYTCKTTGKVYIGQTINESKRKSAHKRMQTDWHSHFYNAIARYGYEDFEYKILYEVISEIPYYIKQVLDLMETYYIKVYQSTNPQFGYNIAAGGGGTIGVHLSEEHKRKISQALKSKHLKLNDNQINALRNAPHALTHKGKTIQKYSFDGDFIEEFDSIRRACQSVGGRESAMWKALNREGHNKGYFKGFYWKFKSDSLPLNFIKPIHHSSIAVKQYSKSTGNLIRIWNSYKEISDFYGNTPASAHSGIYNNPNGYKGYRWEPCPNL